MANPCKLKQFDAVSLSATETNWRKQWERHKEKVIRTEYDRILKAMHENSIYDNQQRELFAYGVFEGDSNTASAIVEVLYPKAGRRWLKQLDLHLSPHLDLSFFTDSVDLHGLADVFGAAVAGTLRLTKDHPAQQVKLYGRSGTLLNYLKGLAVVLGKDSRLKGLTISVEGRWLVFR